MKLLLLYKCTGYMKQHDSVAGCRDELHSTKEKDSILPTERLSITPQRNTGS